MTGSAILNLKALTKLEFLKVHTKSSYALTRCSATARQLAEMIEAMPLLIESRFMLPCEFMEAHPELLRDEWDIGTYFEDHICRQQYLNFLHNLAEEDRANAVAVSDTT